MRLPDGLYVATNDDGVKRFDIRVGLKQSGLISADLYLIEGGQERFDCTFVSSSLQKNQDETIVTFTMVVQETGRTASFVFVEVGDSLNLSFNDGDSGEAFNVLLREPFLRQFLCEVDIQKGIDPDLASFDQAYPPRSINWNGRTVGVSECFHDAGLTLVQNGVTTPIIHTTSWNTNDLFVCMSQNFDLRDKGDPTQLSLLIASSYAQPNIYGIMFDEATRRGAAVFYRTLKDRFGAEFDQNYVRTIVHEIGHMLNLPHAFESGTLAASSEVEGARQLTFMNYPHLYTGGATGSPAIQEASYWSEFDFKFALGELKFLGHGPRDQIWTGTRYIGQTNDDRGAMFDLPAGIGLARQQIGGVCFELRLRPKRDKEGNIFRFGEPIHVEAELANKGRRPKIVQATLQPSAAIVSYVIRKPHGEMVRFEPKFTCSHGRADHELTPGTSLHADICLSFSSDGFPFIEPGRYEIQGVYQGLGPPLFSNVLRLWVSYPQPDEEKLVVPTFDDAISDYFAVGGHVDLEKATEILDELAARSGRKGTLRPDVHPLARYYLRCRAIRSTQDGRKISKGDKRVSIRLRRADPNCALFRQALGLDEQFNLLPVTLEHGLSFSNVVVGRLGHLLDDVLKEENMSKARDSLRAALQAYLRRSNRSKKPVQAFDRQWDRAHSKKHLAATDRDWI